MNLSFDVEVYRNLRTKCWSIKSNGRVLLYPSVAYLENVKFKIWHGAIKTIRKNRRKTPCAFVCGHLLMCSIENVNIQLSNDWSEVKFNPYTHDYFMCNNKRIDSAQLAIMIYPRVYVKV